jgi:hypothetical protein
MECADVIVTIAYYLENGDACLFSYVSSLHREAIVSILPQKLKPSKLMYNAIMLENLRINFGYIYTERTLIKTIKYGSFDDVIIVYNNVTDVSTVYESIIFRHAAKTGNIEMIRFFRDNGYQWDEDTTAYAAKYGHFEVLEWLAANGCIMDENTTAYAAEKGHFNILQWAVAKGCKIDGDAYRSAHQNGHTRIAEWIIDHISSTCIKSKTFYGFEHFKGFS